MSSNAAPPPWFLEELKDACFVVRDRNGQQLANVYFEEGAGAEIGGQNCSLVTRRGESQ